MFTHFHFLYISSFCIHIYIVILYSHISSFCILFDFPLPLTLPSAQEPPPCKPQFVSRLAPELTIPHGEPLNLNCGVEGYPPPKVTWYKDGIPLKDKPECTATYQNGEASLDIPQCGEDDGGVYSCVASNPSGKDSTSCNVLVSGWFLSCFDIQCL